MSGTGSSDLGNFGMRSVLTQVKTEGEELPRGDGPSLPPVFAAPVEKANPQPNPLTDIVAYVAVFLGGTFGTAVRYGLTFAFPQTLAPTGLLSAFHPATFVVNMLASFIFALLATYIAGAFWIRKRTGQLASQGLGTGLCGGMSTMSTLMVESFKSAGQGGVAGMMSYLLASFACGLLLAYLGSKLGSRMAAVTFGETDERAFEESANQDCTRSDTSSAPYPLHNQASGRLEGLPGSVENVAHIVDLAHTTPSIKPASPAITAGHTNSASLPAPTISADSATTAHPVTAATLENPTNPENNPTQQTRTTISSHRRHLTSEKSPTEEPPAADSPQYPGETSPQAIV